MNCICWLYYDRYFESEDGDYTADLIVTEGQKKFVVDSDKIKPFCDKLREHMQLELKHFLLENGSYQGQWNDDDM